jgi:O-antigen ligase
VSGTRLYGLALAPALLLLLGSVLGCLGTLNTRVAQERLVGVVLAGVLALAAAWVFQRYQPLVSLAVAALCGGVWVIALTGPAVFRGPVGTVLALAFQPIFGLIDLTDPVEIANTRFIIGYNGLADLCLVATFAAGALLLERRHRSPWLVGLVGISLALLLGTGARGGLTGLAAGICVIGLFAWPRRYVLAVLVLAPLAAAALMIGALDKGLEFSSTAGRLAYWLDLGRLLVEYPLTGVGLGVDTANNVALLYEINPDPERIYYAHNTFVQAYLEQGPLGVLGMLLIPAVALWAAVVARRHGVAPGRRALLVAGLGVVGALEAHGLTDQVVTTNVGTALVLLALAAVLVSLSPVAIGALAGGVLRVLAATAVLSLLVAMVLLALPAGRTQVLLNIGGLQANRALLMDAQAPSRARALADAESTLSQALAQAPDHPAVLRNLARVRSASYNDAGALDALRRATESPRLDAFDMQQIAHAYRDAGLPEDAYTWAARAYARWGRSPEDAVMRVYAENTLTGDEGGHRARTLAEQAEAAMRARHFGQALSLFEQARAFKPDNVYLQDRVGAAQRAVAKYGPGD